MNRVYFYIFLSFLLGFLMTLLPTAGIQWGKPAWITLILIYWSIAMPEYIGIISASLIGLLIDLLYGSLLGQHMCVLASVAYIVHLFRPLMRFFPVWGPLITVLAAIGFEQLSILIIQSSIKRPPISLWYWMTTLTSVMIWPGIVWTLDKYQKKWS